ncbi:MAG TPA: hypothetical protein VK711_17105, partial [Puia sp.]|nr:hypothetical protein [Puia sp.]
MKLYKVFFLVLFLSLFVTTSFSQDNTLLDSIPTTKEGFIKSETAVINTINWLENTPLNQETDKRKQLSAKFLAWLTNSPTVTVDVDARTAPFTKRNPDLLFIFMGGWTKYSLQNNYSKDAVKCNVAGIKSSIKVYQMGNGLKKDKEMEKIIEINS